MKKQGAILLALLLAIALLVIVGCAKQTQEQKEITKTSPKNTSPSTQVSGGTILLATTTSTKDTGLLDELLPVFKEKYGITVKPIAVGTGEALKMGERGDADVLLVHSRQSEDEFMTKGFGKVREDVMYNDFVLIGPEDDPAGVKNSIDATDAFKKIAGKKAPFISRGDDSGTHKKELKVWGKAGFEPEGSWYMSTGQGMAATIRIANEKLGYTLSDRGTYLVQKDNTDLVILTEKSKDLLNPYGVIAVNPEKYPKANYKGALKFIEFLTSDEGQKIIGEFGKEQYGQPLFVPDAK